MRFFRRPRGGMTARTVDGRPPLEGLGGYGTASGQVLTSAGANALPTWQSPALPTGQFASGGPTSDQSSSSALMTDVASMGFAIGVGEKWSGEFEVWATGAVSGMTFQFTGPASPTYVRVITDGDTTGVTLVSSDSQTAFGTATQAYIVGAFSGRVTLKIRVENGANSGVVQLQFAAAVSGTQTILRGSHYVARKDS